MRAKWALLAAAVAVLTGCQPDTSGEPVGQLVASWSQADHEIQDLQGLLEPGPSHVLLRDAQERDAFVAALPTDMDPSGVQDVVMSAHVLVVGGYAKCDQEGHVYADAQEGRLWFRAVSPSKGDVLCEWSPFTVEAWQVPLDQLGEPDPFDLELRAPDE